MLPPKPTPKQLNTLKAFINCGQTARNTDNLSPRIHAKNDTAFKTSVHSRAHYSQQSGKAL